MPSRTAYYQNFLPEFCKTPWEQSLELELGLQPVTKQHQMEAWTVGPHKASGKYQVVASSIAIAPSVPSPVANLEANKCLSVDASNVAANVAASVFSPTGISQGKRLKNCSIHNMICVLHQVSQKKQEWCSVTAERDPTQRWMIQVWFQMLLH